MARITPETEKRLLDVIYKTAEVVEEIGDPNKAIIKLAKENDIRPSELRLIVHAYNTGRTTQQRQNNSDVFSKAADFQLADIDVILNELYPDTVKTASVIEQDTSVADCYKRSPSMLINQKRQLEKQARKANPVRLLPDGVDDPAPYPKYTDGDIIAQKSKVQLLKRAYEDAKVDASVIKKRASKKFDDLVTYFSYLDSLPLPVVKSAAVLLHGGTAEKLFDKITHVSPHLVKLAKNKDTKLTVDNIDCTEKPFPLIKAVLEKIAEYQEALKTVQEKKAEVESSATPRKVKKTVTMSILSPDLVEKKASSIVDKGLKGLGAFSLLGSTTDKLYDKVITNNPTDRFNSILGDLEDPVHEEEMRSINSQAMLHKLMTNDSVISGYDPNDVFNAYNKLIQLSPTIADKELILQNLLRKELEQGQLDAIDQDQILKFEERLQNQRKPALSMVQ